MFPVADPECEVANQTIAYRHEATADYDFSASGTNEGNPCPFFGDNRTDTGLQTVFG